MNYPNGIKKELKEEPKNKIITYGNRGMSLEYEINLSNEYYRNINKAYIYKKPTPIKIVKVDYPSKNKAIIKEAFFETPSTTDYNGLYNGYYIDFEAKETKNKLYFPLSNIHEHQIKHLENIMNNKGIAFLIIRFVSLNKTFLLTANKFFYYINNTNNHSIPIEYFEKNAYIIKDNYNPRLDYLKIIDNIIGGIKHE